MPNVTNENSFPPKLTNNIVSPLHTITFLSLPVMEQYRRNLLCRLSTTLIIPFLAILFPLFNPHHPLSANLLHSVVSFSPSTKVQKLPSHLPSPPYTLFSTRVILPNQRESAAYISIDADGKIHSVAKTWLSVSSSFRSNIIDVSPYVIMPGLIDPHVHVNEPGSTDWEGYATATRAAAAGGTTTILDMPLNTVPATTSVSALQEKISALAIAPLSVDVGIIGGIVPHSIGSLNSFAKGVLAFKSFLIDSQSEDFPHVNPDQFSQAVRELHSIAKTNGNSTIVPYIVHAELDDNADDTGSRAIEDKNFDHSSYEAFERTRPASWEIEAVHMAFKAINGSNVHLHVAHVSSHDVVKLLAAEKPWIKTATVTAETCPQYLLFAMEDLPRGKAQYKCAPPIRGRENREQMVHEICNSESKMIDLVASDHSPCPDSMKLTDGHLSSAWGGIAGLQYRLQATWTACKQSSANLTRIAEILSSSPARIFGLDNRKGFLKQGFDGDLVIWSPEESYYLSEGQCQHKWKLSAYHGIKVHGAVKYTVVRGIEVYTGMKKVRDDERFTSNGLLLVRAEGQIQPVTPANWSIGTSKAV